MSTCATPYGLTILMMTFMTILFGYISLKWYTFFIFLTYILLIISHYLVYITRWGWLPILTRGIFLAIPILKIIFEGNGSTETKSGIKQYGKDKSSVFIVLITVGILDYIVSYNYTPELGKYTIKNKEDYRRVYTPKWIFVSFIIPIYISLYVIFKSMGLTNAFIGGILLSFIFIVFSYILY